MTANMNDLQFYLNHYLVTDEILKSLKHNSTLIYIRDTNYEVDSISKKINQRVKTGDLPFNLLNKLYCYENCLFFDGKLSAVLTKKQAKDLRSKHSDILVETMDFSKLYTIDSDTSIDSIVSNRKERNKGQNVKLIINRLQKLSFKNTLKSDEEFKDYGDGLLVKVRYIHVREEDFENVRLQFGLIPQEKGKC